MHYNKQKIAKSESRLNTLFVLKGLRLLGGGLFLFTFLMLQYSAVAETPFVDSVQSQVRFENILTGMVAAPDGSFYVAENDSGEITRIRTNSLYSTARFDTLMTGFTDPIGLAFATDGRLLVGERSTGKIIAIGDNQREIIVRGLTDLASIRTDQLDNVYYTEMNPGRVSRFSFRSNGHTVIDDDLSYPADSFNFGRSLLTSELVDRAGVSGRIKMEPIAAD
ncbi:hypothetical protein K8I31_06110, partial [bacterium]|nr:hypothetical protein [bacterium]